MLKLVVWRRFCSVIPVGVEIFLVMREAPLGHDGATATDDAGHALGCERHKPQQDTGVDREVVDALFRLLDQSVPEDLPRQILGAAIDLFERLIDRHGADGYGEFRDPFARGVDVFAGGQIHHGVHPLGGPAHFFDFLLDARCDGGVADVGVDFDEEITSDDHRLDFRMIDVGRDDGGLAAGDLVPDKFRVISLGNVRPPWIAGVLVVE